MDNGEKTVNTYNTFEPTQEPDCALREKMMFFNPFQVSIIEGAALLIREDEQNKKEDKDLGSVVILSSN